MLGFPDEKLILSNIIIINVWLNRLMNSSFNILLSETESKPTHELWRMFISLRMVEF